MVKWDLKDGFWQMDCEAGKEYNFAYVLPQEDGKPTMLVVLTSLQMGWVELPPYFCAATKSVRDIAADYCDTPVGSLPQHKFTRHVMGDKDFQALPIISPKATSNSFLYTLEVYVDDFIRICHPHVSRAIKAHCNGGDDWHP